MEYEPKANILFYEWQTEERYWLPPNMTWDDMERLAPSERPLPRDLFVALPLALGFVVLRYMFERYCGNLFPRLGVRNRLRVSVSPSPNLESFYTQQSTRPTQVILSLFDIIHLMSLCGKSQRQIETWFRLRRHQDKPCQTKKFGEAAWRFFVYLTAFVGGLALSIMSLNLPQPMQSRHFWYYMLELGFYGSLLLRISVDIKRKDFKEQVIHHLATVFLLSFSYCANYIRIGTLVMLLHDSADILLEMEKDERSDEDSDLEEDKREEAEEDYCLTERKGTQSYKLAPLSKNCVLNNLTNHRASISGRLCKAQ
uniref:Ceramide synthase 2-like n=1 Tax=Hippocampus comes TaxID=109280 RepID=A0A3Q2XBE2_HIPCM